MALNLWYPCTSTGSCGRSSVSVAVACMWDLLAQPTITPCAVGCGFVPLYNTGMKWYVAAEAKALRPSLGYWSMCRLRSQRLVLNMCPLYTGSGSANVTVLRWQLCLVLTCIFYLFCVIPPLLPHMFHLPLVLCTLWVTRWHHLIHRWLRESLPPWGFSLIAPGNWSWLLFFVSHLHLLELWERLVPHV